MRIQYFHLQPHSHLANFMIAQHSAHPIPIPKANQQPPQKNTDWAIFGRFQAFSEQNLFGFAIGQKCRGTDISDCPGGWRESPFRGRLSNCYWE